MHQVRIALFVFTTALLVGCETTSTGGTIGGLFPAPKFLKGKIENGIYIAQDKSFSVSIPHSIGSYEYTHMQVKEQYSDHGTYVSFGPSAFDQRIYRVQIYGNDIIKRVMPDIQSTRFDVVAAKVFEGYKAQLLKVYGTMPKEVLSLQETINGRKGLYWRLTQEINNSNNNAYLANSNTDIYLAHDIYIVNFEKGIALVGVQTHRPAPPLAGIMDPRAFAESVVMY